MVAPILKAPKLLLLPAIARQFGIRPSDPDISPIHDDLSGLPPIFIQASSTEVLHDDAVRFSNKAKQAESPVIFQSWAGGLPHVWQIFDDYIEESNAAFDEIEVFFNKNIL